MISTLRAHGRLAVLDLPEHDHIGDVVRESGDFYERRMLEDMRRRIHDGTVVDVGACLGTHSVFLAAVCGLSVIAFEPRYEAFGWLRRNIAINGLHDRIEAHCCALGSRWGRAEDVPSKGNMGAAMLRHTEDGWIVVRRLDSFDLGCISAIKIDVEGMEAQVIRGASKLLQRDHPLVYVEARSKAALSRVCTALGPYGYRTFGRWNATPTYGFEAA